MYNVNSKSTRAQILNAYVEMRDALDQERQAHAVTKDDFNREKTARIAQDLELKELRAKVYAPKVEETKPEAPRDEETTFIDTSDMPSTVPEFCELYCRVNGVKSVPKAAVDMWRKARAGVCGKCNGTGKYVFPDGGWGRCYACAGKGEQTHEDAIRCSIYWKLNA